MAFGIEGIDIEHQLNVRYDPAKRSAGWELENEVLAEFLDGDENDKEPRRAADGGARLAEDADETADLHTRGVTNGGFEP